MRLILALLLLCGVFFADAVKADIRAVKDTGSESLPKMDVRITIDCLSKALIVEPKSNATGDPIAGAQTYLFYTDYEYQLVGSGSTNGSGVSRMNVVGNQDYLTALFILRVDKPGFQSRETEFTYKYCFQSPPPDIGESGTDVPPPPPDLKDLEIEIKPVCSGTAVTGETVLVKSGGAPLPDAFIDVEDISPAKKIATGKTDSGGKFQFPGCGDEYSVRASAGGYESVEINATLTGCNACPLPPPPPPVQPQANGSGQQGSQSPATGNGSGQQETGNGKPEAPSACPLGLAILSILVLRAKS
ncbi:MAG TPA: carboxypeptidase-like regulatory domain-containing protein [Candidatus Bilamarchaeum sp.]|nr:carboxypeptidase-like regulatory domain-containing protein [Candidatus Bilamarchaeum sp.]